MSGLSSNNCAAEALFCEVFFLLLNFFLPFFDDFVCLLLSFLAFSDGTDIVVLPLRDGESIRLRFLPLRSLPNADDMEDFSFDVLLRARSSKFPNGESYGESLLVPSSSELWSFLMTDSLLQLLGFFTSLLESKVGEASFFLDSVEILGGLACASGMEGGGSTSPNVAATPAAATGVLGSLVRLLE